MRRVKHRRAGASEYAQNGIFESKHMLHNRDECRRTNRAARPTIRSDGAKPHSPGLTTARYRHMGWVSHHPHGACKARGVHGQTRYIDPAAQMVIARYASYPVASNKAIDPTSLPAYHALALHLMGKR